MVRYLINSSKHTVGGCSMAITVVDRSVSSKLKLNEMVEIIDSLTTLLKSDSRYQPLGVFSHARIFKDNSFFTISNNSDWYIASYHNDEHKFIPSYDYFSPDLKRFIWRDNLKYLQDRAPAMAVANKFIDVRTAYTILLRHHDYCDRFIIADGNNSTGGVLESFVNHPNLIENLIAEYLQEAESLIQEATKHAVQIQAPLTTTHPEEQFHTLLPTEAINKFLSISLGRKIKLTEREYVFLINSVCGVKPDSIANKFYLSKRTVENILQQGRGKLDCASVTQVFMLFNRTGAFNLYLQPILEEIIII